MVNELEGVDGEARDESRLDRSRVESIESVVDYEVGSVGDLAFARSSFDLQADNAIIPRKLF